MLCVSTRDVKGVVDVKQLSIWSRLSPLKLERVEARAFTSSLWLTHRKKLSDTIFHTSPVTTLNQTKKNDIFDGLKMPLSGHAYPYGQLTQVPFIYLLMKKSLSLYSQEPKNVYIVGKKKSHIISNLEGRAFLSNLLGFIVFFVFPVHFLK